MEQILLERTVLEKMAEEMVLKLGLLLPVLAGKIIFLIVLLLVYPKVVNVILKAMKKVGERDAADPLLISFLRSLVKTILYIVLFFVVTGVLGIKATSLVTILGTAGVAIGLALQGSLTNLASGLIILFFKNISKGDFITTPDGSIEGLVKSIHILYTTITNPDGLAIIIPNSQIANATIINVTKNPTRRLDLVYSTSYNNSIDKTLKVLNQVIDEEQRILRGDDYPIVVSLIKHNSSSLDYRFRVWTQRQDYFDVMYSLNKRVKEMFDENGIEIPYNKLDVYNHIRN